MTCEPGAKAATAVVEAVALVADAVAVICVVEGLGVDEKGDTEGGGREAADE
jgi:hypothetical protein